MRVFEGHEGSPESDKMKSALLLTVQQQLGKIRVRLKTITYLVSVVSVI